MLDQVTPLTPEELAEIEAAQRCTVDLDGMSARLLATVRAMEARIEELEGRYQEEHDRAVRLDTRLDAELHAARLIRESRDYWFHIMDDCYPDHVERLLEQGKSVAV